MKGAPRRTLIFAAVILAANVGGAYLLDALGLVQGLLSPSGAALIYLVPLAALYYVVRLTALFVIPGLVLGAAVLWLLDRRRTQRRDRVPERGPRADN